MFKFAVLVFALIGCALASPLNFESRIVGGSVAGVGAFPYQASLRTAGNGHFCGGWINNNRWVVSAAHCTIGRTTANTRVAVGAHSISDGTVHTTSAIRNHPNYNNNNLANDISVVQTASTIIFNARVATIALGQANVGGGAAAVITGWGQTAHPGSAAPQLRVLNAATLTLADCRNRHTVQNRQMVFDNTICTLASGAQGVCMGDSGGPVVVGNTVVGAVSWVIPCGRGWPDVHARVSSHRTWLLNNM